MNQMICPGDFGGPLFVDGQVAGIASFTASCFCEETGPGYYVAADRLSGWIAETLEEIDPPGACRCNDNASYATREGGCKDLASGIVWSAVADPSSQSDAVSWADVLVEGGKDDWRLPTVREAEQLDRNGGARRAVPLPERIWTSNVVGSLAVAWSFELHEPIVELAVARNARVAVRAGR
jgi:hypothetical protein